MYNRTYQIVEVKLIMTKRKIQYPYSNVDMYPGDILYSTIGRATYYVGHIVIVGTDYLMKESIPGKPSGHALNPLQFSHKHRSGDKITLLRSKVAAIAAANCATKNLHLIKDYNVLNTNLHTIEKNYCSKWIVQAYYFGANVKLKDNLHQFIPPQYFKQTEKLTKIAVFSKE